MLICNKNVAGEIRASELWLIKVFSKAEVPSGVNGTGSQARKPKIWFRFLLCNFGNHTKPVPPLIKEMI